MKKMMELKHHVRGFVGIALGFVLLRLLCPAAAWASTCPAVVGRLAHGPVEAVVTQGQYAYFGSGSVLMVADVLDSREPEIVGEFDLPSTPRTIAVSGHHVFVGTASRGIRVIDVTEPSAPVEVGAVELFYSGIQRIELWGDFAFVLDHRGLHFVDVGDPSLPIYGGLIPDTRTTNDFAVSQGHAYLVDDRGLRVVDVRLPWATVDVGSIEFDDDPRKVDVEGELAVVGFVRALAVIDVSVPSVPVEMGSTPVIDRPIVVKAFDGRAYVVAQGDMEVVDLSDPAAPAVVGFITGQWSAWDVAAIGTTVGIATREQGLRFVDVSVPHAPTEVGVIETPHSSVGVAVAGEFAYLASGYQGLRVVSVLSPAEPEEMAVLDTPGRALGVVVSDETAFVADEGGGLRCVDVSTPEMPVELGSIETISALDLVVHDGLAYVATGAGLSIVDVSNPAFPVEVGSFESWESHGAVAVAVADGAAYLATDLRGLVVIDVSIPSSPTLIDSVPTRGWAYDVVVENDIAYVATDHWRDVNLFGLSVFDVSSPHAMELIGYLGIAGHSRGIAYRDHRIYIAAIGGLWVIDVRLPAAPFAIGYADRWRGAVDVAIGDDLVFTANNGEGLGVYSQCGGIRRQPTVRRRLVPDSP